MFLPINFILMTEEEQIFVEKLLFGVLYVCMCVFYIFSSEATL